MMPAQWTVMSVLPVCVLLATLLPSGARAQEEPRPAVLFLTAQISERPPGEGTLFAFTYQLPDETMQAKLAEAGIAWGISHFSTQLSFEYLKQFNAVVTLGFPLVMGPGPATDRIRQAQQALAEYVQAGGGLLLTGSAAMWEFGRDMEELNRFLEPFGAQVLPEQVREANPQGTVPSKGVSALAWTGNVAPHAVTAGVRGLMYPTDFAWTYYTQSLEVQEPWQVVLKGSPSAHTITVKLGTGGASGQLESHRPGVYSSEPPMLAVREVGQGRMAVLPITPSPLFIDPYHQFWGGGLLMEGTDGARPSDGRPLVLNLLRWLAEPSLGKFTGFEPKPLEGVVEDVGFQPVDWDSVRLGGKRFPQSFKGLIGLKSNLSTGQASPEELIRAAQEAGYDFAGFTEDLEQLTPEKLERLKQVCLEHSDDNFQVYPGLSYFTENGNSWVTFGPTIEWPKEDWWSRERPHAIVKSNMVFRGYNFPPVILTHASTNPEPAWFQGNFKGFALRTYEAGREVNDSTDIYLRLQKDGFDLVPAIVHEARTVAEVEAAAAAPFQTYARWPELADVIGAMSGNYSMYKTTYVFHRTPFVSSGPIIEDFLVYNFGTADLAVPHNDRYRIRLMVSAPKGLREVRLLHGEQLYRRFLLQGEQEWSIELDDYQDRNRMFLAEVTDVDGGQAVSSVRWTNVQELLNIRCTDNINTYTSGKYKGVRYFAIRGLESYIDRQAETFAGFPQLELAGSQRWAVEQRLTQVGRFGWVKDDLVEYLYPDSASPNWNANDQPQLARPSHTVRGRVRTRMITPRADSTVACLVEGEFEAVNDIDLPRDRVGIYATNWIPDSEVAVVARRGGPALVTKLADRQYYTNGSMDGVEYVVSLAPLGGSRAIIPLSENLTYGFVRNPQGVETTLQAGYHVPEKRLSAGERLNYRYLAVWSTVGAPPNNSFMEELVEKMGLRGAPAYSVRPAHGEVLDTEFFLRLRAEGHGFRGTVTQARLPMGLPVHIEGLNERWAAGILYYGRNDLLVPVWKYTQVGSRYCEQVRTPGENQLQRIPVLEGTGWLQVDTEFGDREVFIGNLLVCEEPEVFLQLEDARPGKAVITANNPTDREVSVTIRPGPGFDLLGDFAHEVTLPPGGFVRLSL